jgi:hypothetical protein
MIIRKVIPALFLMLITPCIVLSQSRTAFTGDVTKFKAEVTAFMGTNLDGNQLETLTKFFAKWDSAGFSNENMVKIVNVSSQLSSRLMRPVPHFSTFFQTLNNFLISNASQEYLANWLMGLSETAFNPRFTNDAVDKFIRNSGLMIKDNTLFESGSVKWKVKDAQLKFQHDTAFYVSVTKATLTCYSQKDSTEIYDVTGIYFPDTQQFRGTKGIITWEKAGFARKDVYAELSQYVLNTTKNNFTFDTVKFRHSTYFKSMVSGTLSDKTISFTNPDRATFPKFETFEKEFKLKNIYQGVNYEGGLLFEGANVKGTGKKALPARITLFRNDTLYLRIRSNEFIFSKTGLTGSETSASLYLGKDSIFHPNLGFSYFSTTRQVNLFRTSVPVSKGPFYDSFHNLDMTFESLTWDMNESKIYLTRSKGAALGQAQFESLSYFNADYFLRLMGLDDYHPLNRLVKFAEFFYSETFPIEEFAKWLNKPVEAVTGLCIDLSNKGFVFYDRVNNEITIKKKTKDFLDSYAKRKDYDVIKINSQTKAPTDNAILDLKNYRMNVNGVQNVFLSDSQRVGLYPYKQQLQIQKNRNLQFDGVVEAGLFTVFGHNFAFSYDTFKIRMQKIDSIKIAVETSERDQFGNPVIKPVNNLMHPGSAELLIDDPNNKSGLKSLKKYPIINVITNSYIFYDRIPGLENVYKQKDFYFKVDPFRYENIDHYTNTDMNLPGEFIGGNILKTMKQTLTIQENNSLGFNMNIPPEGIDIYEGKGKLFEFLSMSNKGLIGAGSVKHLTSNTKSDEFKLFPDSMITIGKTFNIEKDGAGLYPVAASQDVNIKWLIKKDEWMAANKPDKPFAMFENGTTLDGKLFLSPGKLNGSGAVNTTDSKINSETFSFTTSSIKAEKADYSLKSPTTNGYSFIAENANTDVNFDTKVARFRLNTDSSLVKFPEIQYICKMTDFVYNMDTKIMGMEQKGKANVQMLTPDKLLRVSFSNLDKPTFFATNSISDTVEFSSFKGTYHRDEEYIEAENINYIPIADALIQPENGKIVINRGAKIKQMQNAVIAVNNKHILHSGKIDIESSKRYLGSAVYDYVDENKEIQQITFPQLSVDTATTTAKGFIPTTQKFMLSPAFSFAGDVALSARADLLTFTGAAGIVQDCGKVKSYNVKFKGPVDPKNILIPVGEKPRDVNDNLVFSGSYINTDSMHIYPAFLSPQKSYTDVALVFALGYLYYDKGKEKYIIGSKEKIADPTLSGNMVTFDKKNCMLASEGYLNFGTKYDLLKMTGAGNVTHSIDSDRVNINSILGFEFYFSQDALKMMADEIRMLPSLQAVNLNSDLNNKGMKDLLGIPMANQIKEEMDLFGSSKTLPKDFQYKLLLNDVKLFWNKGTSSFRSKGKIGIGFIGQQPINLYVDGYVEIQRRKTGDMLDIYLKADESTWYYFSYFRGVLMVQAGNSNFNTLIKTLKLKDRKHPEATVRLPYTYMIASEDRLGKFLKRMASDSPEETPTR